VDAVLLGEPMSFWREHMPRGMYLRSGLDWHLDPGNRLTIEAYLEQQGLRPADVEPLSLDFYLGYTRWFAEQAGIHPQPQLVERLDQTADGNLVATLADGASISARRVVLALGMGYFPHIPPEYVALLPAGRYAHTCDLVDLEQLAGKRCLIVGGRQSAFEWAALLGEAGAAEVHLTYRHPTPAFTTSDWSWVSPIVEDMVDNPGWFRALTLEQKTEVQQRLWAEGRLKLEPWLAERIASARLWPGTRIGACDVRQDGALDVTLDSGQILTVDQIILATGYKVDIARVPLLRNGNLLAQIETRDGYPVLDERFGSSVPGLFFTSFAAGQAFGPFFGFTVSARTAARILGAALLQPEPRAIAGRG
jgi:cation diffusion facilitator CzcD-associated flavoprotein CzcO